MTRPEIIATLTADGFTFTRERGGYAFTTNRE